MGRSEQTCIIILEHASMGDVFLLGIIVDNVSEVVNIKATDIVDTPSFGVKINTEYVMAMTKLEGAVRSLLDVNHIFGGKGTKVA